MFPGRGSCFSNGLRIMSEVSGFLFLPKSITFSKIPPSLNEYFANRLSCFMLVALSAEVMTAGSKYSMFPLPTFIQSPYVPLIVFPLKCSDTGPITLLWRTLTASSPSKRRSMARLAIPSLLFLLSLSFIYFNRAFFHKGFIFCFSMVLQYSSINLSLGVYILAPTSSKSDKERSLLIIPPVLLFNKLYGVISA